MCTGCKECVSLCPVDAIKVKDSVKYFNAYIDEEKCINCERCSKQCQNNRIIEFRESQNWLQGWTNDNEQRKRSSSGGLASTIERAFIENGGYVCSCIFSEGKFIFQITNRLEEVSKFAGSKYTKSDLGKVYNDIATVIKEGKRVLFVGLPCQVEAVKDYIGKRNEDLLYTIDLICHGTPSQQLIVDFLSDNGIDIKEINSISFRQKDKFYLENNSVPISARGSVDKYSLGFLCSIFYTENCYSCKFAQTKRVGDITLGDSWGSNLPEEERQKGISLILCQSRKGEELLEMCDVSLREVEKQTAIDHNQQLQGASKKDKKWTIFFDNYNGSFSDKVFRCLPWKCIKQRIKGVLFCFGIKMGGVSNYMITYREYK